MTLRYLYFRNNRRMVRASENNPPLAMGETGGAVCLLQGGLIKLGFAMPVSTRRRYGAPDGIFGHETYTVVRAFQSRNGLSVDGIAGKQTITRLDELLAGSDPPPPRRPPRPRPPPPQLPRPVPPTPRPAPTPGPTPGPRHGPGPSLGPAPGPTPPAPPPPGVVPPDPDFKDGTDDPTIIPDVGAGAWNSKPVSVTTLATYAAINHPTAMAGAYVAIGDDAVETLRHYFGNTGNDHTIDLNEMVSESPEAKTHYEAIVSLFKHFIERLPVGTYQITSKRAWSGYNHKSQNKNWFFAIGGYAAWIKGRVTVTMDNGVKHHVAEAEYKFFDRYNWDGGKEVEIAGITITDEFMGEFHRQGLAREYNNYGSFRRTFRWNAGDPIPPGQLNGGGR